MRYVRYVARMVRGFVHSFSSGDPNVKIITFGRLRHRRVGNITTDIHKTWWRTRNGLICFRTETCGRQ